MMTVLDNKLPEEFSLRMQLQLKSSYADFHKHLQRDAPVSIRINPKKEFYFDGESVSWCPSGKYLEKRPVFTLDPAFHAGAYYVQEASSMFLQQVFEQLDLCTRPIRVLDLCAAPGGKSTHIVSMLHPDSLFVSNEVIRQRAAILTENMTKWGYDNHVISNNDPHDFKHLPGFFDVVIVDAPCSGEGLLRKDPDAVTEWSVEHVQHCSIRQRRILHDIWPSLKQDGILIYSTCTYNTSENEENIQWLNDQHDSETIHLNIQEDWGIEETSHGKSRGYRFYPHKVKGEGFFLSVVRKHEKQDVISIKQKKSNQSLPQTLTSQFSEWIRFPESYFFHLNKETITVVRKELNEGISFLKSQLKVISAGTAIASRKGTKLIPEHALALSLALNTENFRVIPLTLENALIFLKKDSLILDNYEKGYALVTYNTLPLGWLNVLENRANNLYPKEWRIRMQLK